MSKWQTLMERASAKATEARKLAEKADEAKREMTIDEWTEFKALLEEAKGMKADADAAKADDALLTEAKAIADAVGGGEPAEQIQQALDGKAGVRQRVKSLGLQVVESKQYKDLLKPFGGQGARIPEKTRVQSDPIPVTTLAKSLFTGGSETSAGSFVNPDITDIIEMLGRRELVLRDLISVRTTGSDLIQYVRQTSHTNAAAPVAEATSSALPTAPATVPNPLVNNAGGGYKPEGAWVFEVVTTPVRTIAEWVPATKRALADASQLEGLINDELMADLAETEENEMLNGDGTGEHLDGIVNADIQTQTWAAGGSNLFSAVRKALTKVRTVGRSTPNGILMNPADVETVDLARTDSGGAGTGSYLSGGPFAAGPRTLWGKPLIESEAQVAGFALVGDFSKAVLWDRQQATVTFSDSHADFFIRNLVAALGEERVAFGVTRPLAFVQADIAA